MRMQSESNERKESDELVKIVVRLTLTLFTVHCLFDLIKFFLGGG
jgi:hypothetical protein